MKIGKKILSMVLVLALSLSLTAFAGAQTPQANYNDYPCVFIHGLFGWGPEDYVDSAVAYWGMTSGSMMTYLEEQGYPVAAATVGPISSCWDRCCELYAQLTGTTTDYGEAHVEKTLDNFKDAKCTLGHERYGRDYTGDPIVENWGPQCENSTKINLIGHSFGGPTAVMFLHLLAEGDADERQYAKDNYGDDWRAHCSPLFWGGNDVSELVNSVTSLAGVLNGTTFIDSCANTTDAVCSLMMGVANAIGPTCFNKFYDFQLEQFGITKSDNPDYEYTLDLLRSVSFLDGKDNAIYDLSIAGCNELKRGWECYDDVFYFAYPGCSTHTSKISGYYELPNADTWLPLVGFSTVMGRYINAKETVLDTEGKSYCVINREWLPNDGLVNTISASCVFGCPQEDYDGEVEPGKWITMPTYGYDHMDYGGGMLAVTQNSWQTRAFFDEVIGNILKTYDYDDQLDTPVIKSIKRLRFTTAVELSWDKVDGATGYKIYRAYYNGGSYSLMDTVSDTSWRDYCTLLGKTYYYRITAINKNNSSITSDFSKTVSIRVR